MHNLDTLDMLGSTEEDAYVMGFDAMDALDELHSAAFDRLMKEW